MTDVSTAVQPVPYVPSTGVEIAVPFHIDPATGGVAFLNTELSIINQHVTSLLMTVVGERLMIPTYGGNLPAEVFDLNNESLVAFLQQDIRQALNTWEPSVKILSLLVGPSSNQLNVLEVQLSYSYGPNDDQNNVAISVGGGVNQVTSP